jgi:hypothetical protein
MAEQVGIVNTETVPTTADEWGKALNRIANLAKAHESGDIEQWMRQHPDEEVGGASTEVLDILTLSFEREELIAAGSLIVCSHCGTYANEDMLVAVELEFGAKYTVDADGRIGWNIDKTGLQSFLGVAEHTVWADQHATGLVRRFHFQCENCGEEDVQPVVAEPAATGGLDAA